MVCMTTTYSVVLLNRTQIRNLTIKIQYIKQSEYQQAKENHEIDLLAALAILSRTPWLKVAI